ncbi:MAG: hypothetical protein HKN28_00425 [Alphaproteobacteria bacterium]|nr:hypothetical protein [Alphaproteobacteria bacterium]
MIVEKSMSNDLNSGAEALVVIKERMEDQDMPPKVRDNVRRHYENLLRLAGDLQNLGMGQEQIAEHVIEIFKEYERELASNIERIKAASHSGELD